METGRRILTHDLPTHAMNTPFTFACVCGETFDVQRGESRSCPKCGRHFTPTALAGNLAETMSIHPGVHSEGSRSALGSLDHSDDYVGKTLGHFRILGRLGRGGMGTVYQALDESLQRYVALKVIRLGEDGSPQNYQRVVQEARAQARVNHPHVVHIYFVGLNESAPFFAMELVPGKTLAERLQDGPLPFDEVVRTALQVVSALDWAAQFDIIHGDIKPSNILQVDPTTVKISDFGLSRRLSQSGETNALAGTPVYLSPEATRGEPTDIRSDMYSLGVTLFELTFGRLPYEFRGETLQQTLDAHIAQQPVFPEPWPHQVPHEWREVLARLLAKDPARRYASYAELAHDLKRLMPVRRVPAARLPRALAWIIDVILVGTIQLLAMVPATILIVVTASETRTLLVWIAVIVGTTIATLVWLAGMYLQCRWGYTLGKRLFQLRIVDRHGLQPGRSTLCFRYAMQFLILTGAIASFFELLGLAWINSLAAAAALLITIVSGAMAIATPSAASLHDRIFGTRVVVDTHGTT